MEELLTADNGRVQIITMQISFFFLRLDVRMKIDVRGNDKVKATGIGVQNKFVWYTKYYDSTFPMVKQRTYGRGYCFKLFSWQINTQSFIHISDLNIIKDLYLALYSQYRLSLYVNLNCQFMFSIIGKTPALLYDVCQMPSNGIHLQWSWHGVWTPGRKDEVISNIKLRLVARIFRRGITWMSDVYVCM